MKRHLRTCALGIIVAGTALTVSTVSQAYQYTDVKVSTPGQLAEIYDSINSLKPEGLRISGTLSSSDIIALRQLCGRDSKFNATKGTVRALDLSEVSFRPDGNAFAWYNNLRDSVRLTTSHSIPPLFLYMCNVEEITLPNQIDTIHAWALGGIPLKELYVADGVTVMPRAIALDSLLEKVRLPFSADLYQFGDEYLKELREVESGGFYITSYSPFNKLPKLEKVVVNGPSGHINATPFIENHQLKSIEFNGAVYNTGTCLAYSCENLESIVFNGPVFNFGFAQVKDCNLPKLKEYTFNGPIFHSSNEDVPAKDSAMFVTWEGKEKYMSILADMAQGSLKAAHTFPNIAWFPPEAVSNLIHYTDSVECYHYLPELDSILNEAMKFDINKTKLDILKESAPYLKNTGVTINWRYAPPSDSLLTEAREKFNLDSIAGQGDDYSKIKNLTYWIHETIRHNGSRADRPKMPYDLGNIIEYAQKDNSGGNCRMMAIALQQALLAEGIPARFLTCESKAYDTDSDCHVICVAWSRELDKWVWCDPTFAAFVTDSEGYPLHPGEVRQRLISGKEVCLNDDANWNHERPETKEEYLDDYMAKNLYIISAYDNQRPRIEGPGALTEDANMVVLLPEGFRYNYGNTLTSDESEFWKRPEIVMTPK